MTELQFYKFIVGNDIEWHWINHEDNSVDVIFFPNGKECHELMELCGPSFFDEGGYEITMKHGYFGIYAKDMLEYFGLELDEIFKDLKEK